MSDAPYESKPPMVENPDGSVFSGPGIRAVDTVLRGQRTAEFPAQVVVAPKQYQMLMNGDIPTKELARTVNGRSTFMRLSSSDNVYVASLALFAPKTDGVERVPTLQDWTTLLQEGSLASPRDKTPTPPGAGGSLIYSRVAGVQAGSTWRARTNAHVSSYFTSGAFTVSQHLQQVLVIPSGFEPFGMSAALG